MPEKADISRTLLLPFMSIILLVAVYMTANVLLPLKASGKGSKESEDVQERQHLSDDAGDGAWHDAVRGYSCPATGAHADRHEKGRRLWN